MAAPSVIVCPECDKKFKGRDGLQGRKIKCPACGADFVVGALVYDAVAAAPPAAPPAAKAKPPAPTPPPAGDKRNALIEGLDEDGNPYGVDTPDLAPRCPNCANELQSADDLICLTCGYNTQTRSLGKTKRVVGLTGGRHFKWLLPGLLCLFGMVFAYALHLWYVVYVPELTRGAWTDFLNYEWARLWFAMMLMALVWGLGIFAHKRLLFEPKPPEQEKE